MTQNIYDDATFFAGYSRLGRSIGGLDCAAEWPAMRAMLPDLAGKKVVDLGCGFGWFCRWARGQGAQVRGFDVSENMLARARDAGTDAALVYDRADLEHLDLAAASFDLAYSSLALHYIVNLAGLFATVFGALVPGGKFVFSMEHPIYMAASHPGWLVAADGRKTWPIDGYSVEGPRTTDWLAKGVVKQHRTIGTTLNLLIGTGFTIAHVEEFAPTAQQIAARPDLDEERERPMFLMVAANKQAP